MIKLNPFFRTLFCATGLLAGTLMERAQEAIRSIEVYKYTFLCIQTRTIQLIKEIDAIRLTLKLRYKIPSGPVDTILSFLLKPKVNELKSKLLKQQHQSCHRIHESDAHILKDFRQFAIDLKVANEITDEDCQKYLTWIDGIEIVKTKVCRGTSVSVPYSRMKRFVQNRYSMRKRKIFKRKACLNQG